MTSLPFIALALLHFGNLWGLYFLITAAPKFMSEVLGFNLAQAGILASLPYLARLFSGFVFGQVGDSVRSKGLMTVTQIRKSFCLFCKYHFFAKHIHAVDVLNSIPFFQRTLFLDCVCLDWLTLAIIHTGVWLS